MIKKLPPQVINKIAAGQVIQRPYNVIKQLVENAIDAEATQVKVLILNGGLQSIEVTDNGKGIKKEDFPLLCQRFATSKIADIDDLKVIQSFGFRGQALASLSYVSELQIASQNKNESTGNRCVFKNERMVNQPELFAMSTGTKIMARQLFGGLETRRASLNAGQEKKRVIRLVSHFALHYNLIKFSIETEKGQQFSSDFRALSISAAKMKVFQLITKLSYDKFTYLSKEVLDKIRIEGIITKLNTIKGKTLLLNVNNRIAQNTEISKVVEKAYSECYQSIHEDNQGYFVYLAIQISPAMIDCNQHPSKKTIGFVGADQVYENVYGWLLAHIKEESSIKNIATIATNKGNAFNKNLSFNFKSQGTMSQNSQLGQKMIAENDMIKPDKMSNLGSTARQQPNKEKSIVGSQKNRTDSLQMPLNFYLKDKQVGTSKSNEFRYALNPIPKDVQPSSQNIKLFFQRISYVGCFNLSHILVQLDTTLYFLNVVPFLQSFVREWLQTNTLLIHQIVDHSQWLDLRTIISAFLKRKHLDGKVKIEQILDKILINKHLLTKQYGITVQQVPNRLEGRVSAFPIFQKFMSDRLIQDELAYLLCRLYNKEPSPDECDSYFVNFLITLFEDNSDDGADKDEKNNTRFQLNPLNDLYSDFFRNKVIPILKTKGKDYGYINFTEHLTQMVSLKDVYHIFERC